jgi:NADH:quinone reductase (non-electrogenic)
MKWDTRITRLLGCQYPVLQGAVAKLGIWQLAAAIADAGAHGVITASVSKTSEQLQADIQKCRQPTSGSFGVNFSIGVCPDIDQMLEVCIAEQLPIETALYKPDAYADRIKQSGLPWIHKAARVKDAHAFALGADAVILVGLEGGGFKNPARLPTLTTVRHAVRTLSIPVIAEGMIGALALKGS